VSYRPDLAALLVDRARVATLTDAVYRIALVDLLKVRALVGAVFGDSVRVVSSGPAGPSAPAGCWGLPTLARTIESVRHRDAHEVVPVLWGDGVVPRRTGFTCAVCHPPVMAATAARRFRRTDRTEFLSRRGGTRRTGTEEQDVETETDV
jgi:hypothetical protein